MKLEAVNIKRFQSIENIALTNCGAFNVFIGKNNTGKSNILSAIEVFFRCIKSDSIIISDPPIGNLIDFYGKDSSSSPIEITITFLLSLLERDAFIQDIIGDAPQMRNALEGIEPTLKMLMTLSIINQPVMMGFISKIAITNSNLESERIILKVEEDSALELYNQITQARQHQQTREALLSVPRRIDRDDWRFITGSESRPPRQSIRAFLRRFIPPELLDEILFQISTAPGGVASYEDFVTYTQNLAKKMQEQEPSHPEELLRYKIETFAGQESSVPNYVLNILKKVSTMQVLYLLEQRKPIGKDEAARLLSLKTRRRGPSVLQNIQETVTALLGVRIDAFESDTIVSEDKPVAELDIDDFLVQVNGSGIRESLGLILDVEFEEPHILLVEEQYIFILLLKQA